MGLGLRILVLASFIFGAYFVRNSVKRETKHIVRVALLFGLVTAVGAAVLNSVAQRVFKLKDSLNPKVHMTVTEIVISTAIFVIIEETIKFLPLVMFLHRKKYFTMLSDGVLFFGLAGLTFGAIEHLFYGLNFGEFTILLRLFLVLFLHAGLTGMVGYFYAKDRLLGNSFRTVFALLLSVTLHFAYNMSLFMADRVSKNSLKIGLAALGIIIATGLNCLLIWLFYLSSQRDWLRIHGRTNGPVPAVTNSLIY